MEWMDTELLRMPSRFHPAGGRTGIMQYLVRYCSLSLADSITALHPILFLSQQ
jgi:hypothetical protein